jgi:DNA-binding HxlR family transcriptional regulator
MQNMRTYGDACGVARALDRVGERWTLLVVRELLLGPKRFTDLRAGIPNASPNVLSQRLRALEEDGVVRRRRLGPPAGARVYELTDWGLELEPVITQLGRWGARSSPAPGAGLGADALVLALRTLFDPDAAGGHRARYDLRLGADRFRVEVAGGRLEAVRGEAPEPDATIETDPGTLAAVLWHGRDLAGALSSGEMRVQGSAPAVARLLRLFPLPAPAPPAARR